MATDLLFKTAFGTLVESHQNSDLASLADAAYALGTGAGAVINNTSDLLLLCYCRLNLGSITPAGAAHISLFLIRSMDGGSTYEDPQTAIAPPAGIPTQTRGLTTGASAKVVQFEPFILTPGHHKLLLGNLSGAALNASNNTLKYWLDTYRSV